MREVPEEAPILQDAEKVDDVAVQVVQDFGRMRTLRKENVGRSAERLDVDLAGVLDMREDEVVQVRFSSFNRTTRLEQLDS